MNGFIKVITALCAGFLIGCGGGESQPEQQTTVYTGYFLDSPVEGLEYTTTSNQTGTTGVNGEFKYQDGDEITFKIGQITFPSTIAKHTLTPFDLYNSQNIYNPSVLNTIQLLQSLDENKDPTDGIKLDNSLVQQLSSTNIDHSTMLLTRTEFEQALLNSEVFNNSDNELLSSSSAVEHFIATLSNSDVLDSDFDGLPNRTDPDDDNDGTFDDKDAFPWDKFESIDFDLDGIGDNADTDDDNDNILDTEDNNLQIIYDVDDTSQSVSHILFHSSSNRVFITNKAEKTLKVLNPETGLIIQTLYFEKMPWRMAITKSTLYLTLLDRDFQYYSQEDGSGEVASFLLSNTLLQEQSRFSVSIDPFDIVATDNGKVIISSGSSQWTSIVAYNAFDGLELGRTDIRHKSYLSLHPSQKWVFAANTDTSPSDFEKFDIESPGITSLGDSPYHGDYAISGGIWVTDNYIYSRNGHVFNVSDMTYSHTLGNGLTIDDIQFDYQQNTAYVISNTTTYLVNLTSSEVFKTITYPGPVQQLLLGDNYHFAIAEFNNSFSIIKTINPCMECGSNTKPTAAYTYTPINGSTVDTYEFDAANSSDIETPDSLQYRWDMNNDNEWDNDFTNNPLFSTKFLMAGTKYITLQVKDAGGLVSTKTLDIYVEQGVDAGNEIEDATPYELQFNVTDVVTDQGRQKLYISDISNKRLYVVNQVTGQTEKYFEFSYMPERMTLSPDSSTLYLALLAQNHNSYWWEEDQYGYIAVFDLDSQSHINTYGIPTDPYDLVVNQNNKLIVSSGSGQWTDIYAFDAIDGSILGKSSIRQASTLSLHPSGNYVFAADTDTSPSDFEKFDISGVGITSLGDSPYHGDYSISGKVWVTPDGSYVISRGGHVFLASDMTYVQSLTGISEEIENITFDESKNIMFLLTSSGQVQYVNSSSLITIGTLVNSGANYVSVSDENVYILKDSNAFTELISFEHPCTQCGENTAPIADFTYTPTAGSTVDTYEFDASNSNDIESPNLLQYRWDMNNDNEWDNDFTNNPLFSTKFLTAGTKYVTLQVKDAGGLVSTKILDIYVEQGVDAGNEIEDGTPYELQFSVTDVVTDQERQKLYISDISNKRLYVVNQITGQTEKYFEFSYMPERMTLSPDGSTLYLALLVQNHSSYWSEEEQYGYIAVFDLDTQTQINTYEIPTSPYDLVVNQNNKLIVSSGSGQWTDIYAFDAIDGSILGKSFIRQASTLTLHPSGDYVFAADTDLSPSDFEKFDISGVGITSLGDSPYHGDYSISGKVWVTPDGSYVISRGGHVFLASDMTYVQSLTEINTSIEHIAFDESQNIMLVATASGQVQYVNSSSLITIGTLVDSGANYVSISDENIYILKDNNAFTNLISFEHPCTECGENTAPIADFTYTPTAGSTVDTYEFDASNSDDQEDPDSLQYRWDMNNDNEWDNDFTNNPLFSTKFLTAGTKYITLQVKDAGGLVSTKSLDIYVEQGIDTGNEVEDGTPFELQFNVTEVVTDQERQKLYISDISNKRLYVVNQITGQTEKYFEFSYMPERMTLSPDGSTLYLALLVQNHSSYWWEEEQYGYIAAFDLDSQSQINIYEVPTDPYDLVVNQNNKLIVSSGSGQWTDIYAFDAIDGSILGKSFIRQASTLTLHPSGDYVFAADTDTSPSDFEKFDISGVGITSLGDSPYHGDYSISGKVWVTPDGSYVISRGGHVFLASDMTYVQSLTDINTSIEHIAFDESQNIMFVATASGQVQYINSSSLITIGTLVDSGANYVSVSDEHVYILKDSNAFTNLISFEHPCTECGENTAPIADFTYTATDGSSFDTYEFDASNSDDQEDPDSLQYRWDTDNDNEWDNNFSNTPFYSIEFLTAGTKFVTLQVKDTGGLVSNKTLSISVE